MASCPAHKEAKAKIDFVYKNRLTKYPKYKAEKIRGKNTPIPPSEKAGKVKIIRASSTPAKGLLNGVAPETEIIKVIKNGQPINNG